MNKKISIIDNSKSRLHDAVEYFMNLHALTLTEITGYYIADSFQEERYFEYLKHEEENAGKVTCAPIKTLYFVAGRIESKDIQKGVVPFPSPLTVDSLTEIAWDYFQANAQDRDFGDGDTVKAFCFEGTDYIFNLHSCICAACKITPTNLYYGK